MTHHLVAIDPTVFDLALREAAYLAYDKYPAEVARIGRGLELALAGHVTQYAGYATVRSSAGHTEYHINGQCHCMDTDHAPEGRCKHLFSVWLVKKAWCLLQGAYYATLAHDGGMEVECLAFAQRDGSWRVRGFGEDGVYPMPASGRSGYMTLTLGGNVAIAETQRVRDGSLVEHVAGAGYSDWRGAR